VISIIDESHQIDRYRTS